TSYKSSVSNSGQVFPLSSSPQSYLSPLSLSLDTNDSILHRQPTFSYIPIHKRRRSGGSSSSSSITGSMFLRSINSLNSLSISSISSISPDSSSDGLSTPGSSDSELLMPTTPTSSIYSPADNSSMEYTSFPNLEKFSDEGWTEIRIEKCDPDEIQMESYDEMLVGGVRFRY
ncbi:1643_t:CDS:1, partial [Acaulospora colombiana]